MLSLQQPLVSFSQCIGVDACRAGWIAVQRVGQRWRFATFGTFGELLTALPESVTVMVDIPIGLPWSSVPKRPCDVAARRLLSSRASCVFSPPTRAAVFATSIAEARRLNVLEVGSSISAQAWGIAPKIAEVDTLMRHRTDVRHRVKEVHPELCFWRLNGDRVVGSGKKTIDGRRERLSLLNRAVAGVEVLLAEVRQAYPRSTVADDDVLDATAACVTGLDSNTDVIGGVTLDEEGLPMQMHIRHK